MRDVFSSETPNYDGRVQQIGTFCNDEVCNSNLEAAFTNDRLVSPFVSHRLVMIVYGRSAVTLNR